MGSLHPTAPPFCSIVPTSLRLVIRGCAHMLHVHINIFLAFVAVPVVVVLHV